MCKETSPSLNYYGQSQSGNSICADSSHLPWTRVMFKKKSREDEETYICSRQNIDLGGARKRETSCDCTWKRNRSSIRSRQRGKQQQQEQNQITHTYIHTYGRIHMPAPAASLRKWSSYCRGQRPYCRPCPDYIRTCLLFFGVSSPSIIYNIYYTSHGVLFSYPATPPDRMARRPGRPKPHPVVQKEGLAHV